MDNENLKIKQSKTPDPSSVNAVNAQKTEHSHTHTHTLPDGTTAEHSHAAHEHSHAAGDGAAEHVHTHAAGDGAAEHVHTHTLEDGTAAHGHTHTHENTKAVLNRLSRAIGHLESVKRMVEDGRDCSEVLIQLSAVKSAINNTGKIILQDHIEHCLVDAIQSGDMKEIDELNKAIGQFIK